MNIDRCVNLDDLRVLAKKRVPKLVYDFIEGGVDDEEGLQRNEDAFQRRSLVPRYMVDVSTLDQSVELFGRTWSSPYGIAPTGGIGNYRRGGDMMLVRAARDANIPFIMSGAANASMEDMAREAPEHGWYQMYTAKDRSISEDMIRRAATSGFRRSWSRSMCRSIPTGSATGATASAARSSSRSGLSWIPSAIPPGSGTT